MAGGRETRGKWTPHTYTCMNLPKHAANSMKAQGWRRLEEQCDALMVSTVSCWGRVRVFLGLMSVLCSCKAWTHSSGARARIPTTLHPPPPSKRLYERGREGGRLHSPQITPCLWVFLHRSTPLVDPLSCPLSTQRWGYFRINPLRKQFPFTAV